MAVERWVVYPTPPGTNGETVFGNVFRRSFPTSQGTLIPTTAGTHNYVFTYKKDPVWQDSSIYTMAFVQNDADKTLMNISRPGMLVGIEPYTSEVPNTYSLQQNFPNPFNPSTNIKFALPVDEYVTLKVYDMLGNEVKTLVEGVHKAGSYNMYFEGTNLASGIYFYTLKTGSFSETKKMMLVK